MRIAAIVALLQLCLSATGEDVEVPETHLTAAPGDNVILPCHDDATPSSTKWLRHGVELTVATGDPPAGGQRLSLLRNGSLSIAGVEPGDEDVYQCIVPLPDGTRKMEMVHLEVTPSGPSNVSISAAGPVTPLPNGTLVTARGSSVSFNCSSDAHPSLELSWAFSGASSSNDSLASSAGPWLAYRVDSVQPSNQGLYSCRAHSNASHQTANQSRELLVYYVPDRHPECMWFPAQDPSCFQFNCSWLGAYPLPKLRWRDEDEFQETDSLSVTLNRSALSEGQTLKCTARHQLVGPQTEKSCSFTFRLPYPEGDVLATALEDTNVTLICSEATSLPPASTTWRRGILQDVIVPGTKYLVSENGPDLKLTILNVSKDDEGLYFCRSENPLAVRELEVYLTVKKASSAYTGAIIGIFIAALIVGSTAVVAKTLYTSRHRICLGDGFGQMDDDQGDVLSLVEVDDEQIFQDTVPRLPPVTNGNHTTQVQIHRIPSNDQEDGEAVDTGPQQQEEPEDLVTF